MDELFVYHSRMFNQVAQQICYQLLMFMCNMSVGVPGSLRPWLEKSGGIGRGHQSSHTICTVKLAVGQGVAPGREASQKRAMRSDPG